MDIERLKIKFMEMMQAHKGRERAIPRERIFFELKIFSPDLTDRKFRDMYSRLPICSTSSMPYGLYLPETTEELEGFLREYSSHVGPIHAAKRRRLLFAAYPKLVPKNERQGDLFYREQL
jgi:hypothetical protein